MGDTEVSRISKSSTKNHDAEDREEIIIVIDDPTRSNALDESTPDTRETPHKERDDEIDVTTISSSPTAVVGVNAMMAAAARVAKESTRRVAPSSLNLDNFGREEARELGMRQMYSHLDKNFRQAIDHDYASLNRPSGGAGARFGAALFRQPAASTTTAARPAASLQTVTPIVPVPPSPSALRRRKRKGASVDHAADSDSDDPEEELFRSAKIEYTNVDGPAQDDYSCPRCPAQFESRVGLTNHLKLHGSKKKFPCDLCDFSCTNKKTMRQHRRVHGIMRRPPAKRMLQVAAHRLSLVANAESASLGFDNVPEKGKTTTTNGSSATNAPGIAKFASSHQSRKGAPSGTKRTAQPSPKRFLAKADGQVQKMPQNAQHTLEEPQSSTSMLSVTITESVEESPPPLRAIGVDVKEESQQQPVNQPIIRAIDFALKLNLDENGNPRPLPPPEVAQPRNQFFSLGVSIMAPSTSTAELAGRHGDDELSDDDLDAMPMLPLEIKNEETTDDEVEEAEEEEIKQSSAIVSNKNKSTPKSSASATKVKCKECPFGARSVARLQPHLSGHTRETGYKCQFCSFKSESLGFLKRHMNMHGKSEYTWPPEYVGDTHEQMEKLLARERKRLALERRRKAEADRAGANISKAKLAKVVMNDSALEKSDPEEEEEIVTALPVKVTTTSRGKKAPAKNALQTISASSQPTRRSTRTSKPPKPLYTTPALSNEPNSRLRRGVVTTMAENASSTPTEAVSTKKSAQKSSIKAISEQNSPSKSQKLTANEEADSSTETATSSASVNSSDKGVRNNESTKTAKFNECKYCDYKTAARAPVDVMNRHVLRRHKNVDSTLKA